MGGQASHGYNTQKDGCQIPQVHIYRLLHKWGFSPKVPQKRFVNTAPEEVKRGFKKGTGNTRTNPEGFTIASG